MALRRLVLMRHGEARLASHQAPGDLFSLGDLPLSPRGRAQAEAARAVVDALGVEAAYASPALRARETAEIVVASRGLGVERVPDLREFPFQSPQAGYEQVLGSIVALASSLKGDPDPLLPGGERYGAAKARFALALEGIVARHACALVVAHGITNRVWLAELLGMPAHALFRLEQSHACVNVVEYHGDDRRPVVRALNVPPGF